MKFGIKHKSVFGFSAYRLDITGTLVEWVEVDSLSIPRSSHTVITVPRTMIPRCWISYKKSIVIQVLKALSWEWSIRQQIKKISKFKWNAVTASWQLD